MATSIVVRETADSSAWDIPDPEVVKSGGHWTPEALGRVIDELCARYDLPTPDQFNWESLGDSVSGTFQEAAPRLYLAAAAACALRTGSAFPAIAFGAWSATDLAMHLGVAAPPRLAEPDLFTEPELPQAGPAADPWASVPVVLVGELPEPGRVDALTWSPLLANPRIEELGAGAALLRAGVRLPRFTGESAGPDPVPTGDFRSEYAVEIRSSLLLKALGCGLDLLERETGARVLPGESLEGMFDRRVAPGPEWAAVVPDLPTWARTLEAFGLRQSETVALWQALTPVPVSPPAEAALRTRACLAHQLFTLTAYSPALGWAALLTGSGDSGAAVAAARAAGIRVLPPSVQSAVGIWDSMDASVPTVRAPLRVFANMTSTADEIARSYRLEGPFISVADLVRRVPATAADSDLMRRLVEVGALDSLCDRALVTAHWTVVSAWCKNAPDSVPSEPMVEGVSLFAIPPIAEAGNQEPNGWWERFVMDGASPAAPDVVSFASLDGSVELREAFPRESRTWHNAGEDLIVLAMRADDRQVHAVIAASGDGQNNPRSVSLQTPKPSEAGMAAVWVDTALFSPKVGHVDVLVPLLGDRDRDLERLRRVQTILARHPGDLQVHLALMHGESRRDLPRTDDTRVGWSGALVDDLEVLLGPNCVRLRTGT